MSRVLKTVLFSAVATLAACSGSETWVFAPVAEESVELEQDEMLVMGEAVLRYDPRELPPADDVVSNALRLTATATSGEELLLRFPSADPADLVTFTDPGMLNVEGVYRDCDRELCRVIVPFEVERRGAGPTRLELSGDAILTRASLTHVIDAESDEATLRLRLLQPDG